MAVLLIQVWATCEPGPASVAVRFVQRNTTGRYYDRMASWNDGFLVFSMDLWLLGAAYACCRWQTFEN